MLLTYSLATSFTAIITFIPQKAINKILANKMKQYLKNLIRKIYHIKFIHKVAAPYFISVRESIEKGNTKHIKLSVSEIFFQQNTNEGYNRYDTIVRLLAVENYYGLNDYGFDFYKRMQAARVKQEYVDESITKFYDLITSFEGHGYDSKSEILLDKDLHLLDGSHRLALAIYYNIKEIRVRIRKKSEPVFYGIEWFKINGFNELECNILVSKFEEIKARLNVPFICTIWSPASKYFDSITENLKLFGEVKEFKDYEMSESEYRFKTHMIYAIDDIAKWKIEKKLEYMTLQQSDCYKIRKVTLLLNSPNFRLKKSTNKTLSIKCEQIKQLLREGYMHKINNYFYDIIIHIGDNFYQNTYINRFFELPEIDIKQIFETIYHYDYVLTKFDVPYMPKDFPNHYPKGKDFDIVCKDESNYQKIISNILEQVSSYKEYYEIKIETDSNKQGQNYRSRIRIEFEKNLILLFDVICKLDNLYITSNNNELSPEFDITEGFITNGLIKIPSRSKEILVRLLEIHTNPEKKHHIEYVLKNKHDIDSNMCDKYLKFNWRKIIKE